MSDYLDKKYFLNLSTKHIYENSWISVDEDTIKTPDGTVKTFGVVSMRPGSTVLALDLDDYGYIVEEFKYGIKKFSLELISGGIELNESPMDAAKRELQEEISLEAEEWTSLGYIDPFTSVIDSKNHMFLARRLRPSKGTADPGELLKVIRLPFDEMVKMVENGEITHGASCVAILKTSRLLSLK